MGGRSPGHGSSLSPRTIVGRWLVAALLGQEQLRDQLATRINPGGSGWTDDESAVAEAACEIAVRRHFRPGYDIREVTELAVLLRDLTGEDPGKEFVRDPMQVEAIIRAALGEADVDVSDVMADAKVIVHNMATVFVTATLKFGERDVKELVVKAERKAFKRGWNPPRAGS